MRRGADVRARFARAGARAHQPRPRAADLAEHWAEWAPRLAAYLGDAHPLAQRVGGAAGEAMGAPSSAELAWEFGLARVLDGLAALAPG